MTQRKIQRLSAQQILEQLKAHRSVLERYGVRKIGLFGSYRRGTPRADSDMDFLVDFDRLTFDNYMNVKIYLEDLFECKVDLVLEETIKPRLRPYILNEVVLENKLPDLEEMIRTILARENGVDKG